MTARPVPVPDESSAPYWAAAARHALTDQQMARRLWEHTGIGPDEVDLPQVYDGFSPFVWFWLEVLGLCPPGEAHRFVASGGIDSDDPGALPALSGGGALGNGRMHGIPQMLECYLQLAKRAGDRQRARATVGIACQSSPHYGGAVMYTAEPTRRWQPTARLRDRQAQGQTAQETAKGPLGDIPSVLLYRREVGDRRRAVRRGEPGRQVARR